MFDYPFDVEIFTDNVYDEFDHIGRFVIVSILYGDYDWQTTTDFCINNETKIKPLLSKWFDDETSAKICKDVFNGNEKEVNNPLCETFALATHHKYITDFITEMHLKQLHPKLHMIVNNGCEGYTFVSTNIPDDDDIVKEMSSMMKQFCVEDDEISQISVWKTTKYWFWLYVFIASHYNKDILRQMTHEQKRTYVNYLREAKDGQHQHDKSMIALSTLDLIDSVIDDLS